MQKTTSIILILTLWVTTSITSKNQGKDCYSVILLTNDHQDYIWSKTKATGSKAKLIKFLKTDKLIASCEYPLGGKTDEQIAEAFELIENCTEENIKIEFTESKDFIEFYKVVKKSDSQLTTEVCINSNGEASLSFSNELGSFQVNTKGIFSLSVKGANGQEFKSEL